VSALNDYPDNNIRFGIEQEKTYMEKYDGIGNPIEHI
jgi:hypothetical protein